MDKTNAQKLQELRTSIGATAECAHLFYQSMLTSGATVQEATAGMNAWIIGFINAAVNKPKSGDSE